MEPTRQPELLASGHGRPIRIGGDVLLVKALTGTTDGVAVLETVAKPGEPAPLDHVHHSYDEVFYVIEGEFEFRVGGRRVRAPAGSVVTAPRGSPHTFKNCGDGDGRVLIVGAPGRAAIMLEEIGAMVAAGVGPLPEDGLAGVYGRHDTTLVPPLAADEDEPEIDKR
jgi:mannose-6-phosphate isomerase-like protein (cupin superfamily)